MKYTFLGQPARTIPEPNRVNFLAHDVVLPPESPAVLRIAAAVPDLWSFLPKRPLPVTIRETTRASHDPAVRAVGAGVSAHLVADATFHRHSEFLRRVAWLKEKMATVWPRLDAELGAHVMVEMLLDRWLLRRDSGLVHRYYASFCPAGIAFVSVHAAVGTESQEALAKVLERFASSRFLADYADSASLVMRFVHRLERVRFAGAHAPPIEQLVSSVEGWAQAVEDGSRELLETVRTAVRAKLDAADLDAAKAGLV
jgi:hypothetical protein